MLDGNNRPYLGTLHGYMPHTIGAVRVHGALQRAGDRTGNGRQDFRSGAVIAGGWGVATAAVTGWMREHRIGYHLTAEHMMTSSNGNIFRVTDPLCGEFTGHGELLGQRPVTRSFDVFIDLCLDKQLSKQSWGWWFATPSRSLRHHYNGQSDYADKYSFNSTIAGRAVVRRHYRTIPSLFNMLSHTDDLVSPPSEIVTTDIFYLGLINPSVWHKGNYFIHRT